MSVKDTGTVPERPWLMRTYSGHTSAATSNELYRKNLAKGQTGLSVAFDLPTQTGFDADHPLARGEVGKVGVPISHIEDLDILFTGMPLDEMNTSMTINATAAWLLSLYIALAERRGIDPASLRGTTQNDIIKEYLSRGTYIFPPEPSVKLTVDTIAYTVKHLPNWNPINVCSYHLQEAGATPVQELAYALGTAQTIVDAVRDSGQVKPEDLPKVVGRISFFLNSGIRFIEETCKVRAFEELWGHICRKRYKIEDPAMCRFRYGVQVNSLGLTESQPENNVQRIMLEMMAVTLSKKARARAIQLPAWNEALGLPRSWDQQWALRMQQVLAYETDLLEYGDILDGSPVIAQKVRSLKDLAVAELERVKLEGGMLQAVESGYIKRQLVRSQAERLRSIERGDLKVVGVNCFKESEPSQLGGGEGAKILKTDPEAERDQVQRLQAHRERRNDEEMEAALDQLKQSAQMGKNIMPASIRCAHSGVTTGEWGRVMREVFGEYRAPTGVDVGARSQGDLGKFATLRQRVQLTGEEIGRPVRMLVGKPGLDGHSNGAEQVAVKARDLGVEVVYEGIRLTARQIAVAALEEGVHMIGLSVLSGSHLELVRDLVRELEILGVPKTPFVIGGIIPPEDLEELEALGAAGVFTPKDAELNDVMTRVIDIIRESHGLDAMGGLQ